MRKSRGSARLLSVVLSVEVFAAAPALGCSCDWAFTFAGMDQRTCAGESVQLDGSRSYGSECRDGFDTWTYRWLVGSEVIRDWSHDPLVTVEPATTTTYTLEFHVPQARIFPYGQDQVTVEVIPSCPQILYALAAAGDAVRLRWVRGAAPFALERDTDPGFRAPYRVGSELAERALEDHPPEAATGLWLYRLPEADGAKPPLLGDPGPAGAAASAGSAAMAASAAATRP